MSYVFLTIPLHEHKVACLPVCNDEIAGARPNMNIEVAAYVMAHLHYYTILQNAIHTSLYKIFLFFLKMLN